MHKTDVFCTSLLNLPCTLPCTWECARYKVKGIDFSGVWLFLLPSLHTYILVYVYPGIYKARIKLNLMNLPCPGLCCDALKS